MNGNLWRRLHTNAGEAPPMIRRRLCDAVWFMVCTVEDSDTMDAWAVELWELDGAVRRVPGDVHDKLWQGRTDVRPCALCGRTPCYLSCELADTDTSPTGRNDRN